MKRISILILLYLFICFSIEGQSKLTDWYFDIDEALMNPFAVKKKCLQNPGKLPDCISNLVNLEELIIYGNDWEYDLDTLPIEFYSLSSLKSLSIYCTEVKSFSSSIKNLTKLEYINVEFELPPEIVNLPNLKQINRYIPESIYSIRYDMPNYYYEFKGIDTGKIDNNLPNLIDNYPIYACKSFFKEFDFQSYSNTKVDWCQSHLQLKKVKRRLNYKNYLIETYWYDNGFLKYQEIYRRKLLHKCERYICRWDENGKLIQIEVLIKGYYYRLVTLDENGNINSFKQIKINKPCV